MEQKKENLLETHNKQEDFGYVVNFLGSVKTLKKSTFTFIDLFAGIGGFHLASLQNGGKCVMACEIDKAARQTYLANCKVENFAEDVTKIVAKDVPDHDLLCAGFPCQPFSQSGFKKGFNDIRGTLFFHIARIIKVKKPKAFFLENVRYLLNHDSGRTFARIKEVLEGLGYCFFYKVVKASDFGLPQHRPRLFMVGFKNRKVDFKFPERISLKITMSDIFGEHCNKTIGFTLRVGGRGSRIDDRRNWDRYLVGGREYKIQPKDAIKMMGFPDDFKFPVSKTQAMKQLGNSVAVPAVSRIIKEITKYL